MFPTIPLTSAGEAFTAAISVEKAPIASVSEVLTDRIPVFAAATAVSMSAAALLSAAAASAMPSNRLPSPSTPSSIPVLTEEIVSANAFERDP